MPQRGALAGSLQCFAKTNGGYGWRETILKYELSRMSSDPTRARYLPVPSTTHLALQPNDSERQLLQTSKSTHANLA
jgi:hypothetical protein